MSLEDAKETNVVDKEENNEKELETSAKGATKAKKDRKPFEWTEKRKMAFDKMRAGLELKNEIALKLKAEKQKSEKEEIKKRVREIMNGQLSKEKEASSASSEDSEEEVKASKKLKKVKVDKKAAPKVEARKEKKGRKAEKVASESEKESSDEAEQSGSESEKYVRSKKSVDKAQKNRVQTGKTQRTSTHYLNSDRFILL